MKIPHQNYKPKNLQAEIMRLLDEGGIIVKNGLIIIGSNYYQVNYDDKSITVN